MLKGLIEASVPAMAAKNIDARFMGTPGTVG